MVFCLPIYFYHLHNNNIFINVGVCVCLNGRVCVREWSAAPTDPHMCGGRGLGKDCVRSSVSKMYYWIGVRTNTLRSPSAHPDDGVVVVGRWWEGAPGGPPHVVTVIDSVAGGRVGDGSGCLDVRGLWDLVWWWVAEVHDLDWWCDWDDTLSDNVEREWEESALWNVWNGGGGNQCRAATEPMRPLASWVVA